MTRRRPGPPAGPPETGDLFAAAMARRAAREAAQASQDEAPGPAREPVREPLTVLALTEQLKAAVEPRFKDVWVQGELANLRTQASGHVYFTLKDDGATLPCAMWASQARRLRFDLEEGQEVVARGRVEIYPPHGKYQLIATDLEPRGAGALAVQLEQVKARLAADGLLDLARKRPLPFLPRRIGVATSPTAAALRDFLRVLHARFPNLPVLVAPCRVQGEGAADTVTAAVQALARHGVDVIVMTRGGGSQEDLWAFNDERLARAIAASPVPVVSAVGHEIDVSVADLVADVRAATPTHAAQLVAPVKDELLAGLAALRGRAHRAVAGAVEGRRGELRALKAELADPAHLLSAQRHRLEDLLRRAEGGTRRPADAGRSRLDGLRARLGRAEPRQRLRGLRQRVELASRRLDGWRAATFRREQVRLERLAARLEPANVAKLLSRGFALVLAGGRLVARSAEVAPGDAVRLALGEGWLDARVTARDLGGDPVPGRGQPGAAGPGSPGGSTVDSSGRQG